MQRPALHLLALLIALLAVSTSQRHSGARDRADQALSVSASELRPEGLDRQPQYAVIKGELSGPALENSLPTAPAPLRLGDRLIDQVHTGLSSQFYLLRYQVAWSLVDRYPLVIAPKTSPPTSHS